MQRHFTMAMTWKKVFPPSPSISDGRSLKWLGPGRTASRRVDVRTYHTEERDLERCSVGPIVVAKSRRRGRSIDRSIDRPPPNSSHCRFGSCGAPLDRHRCRTNDQGATCSCRSDVHVSGHSEQGLVRSGRQIVVPMERFQERGGGGTRPARRRSGEQRTTDRAVVVVVIGC
jgi:hypothetical protein